MPFGATGSQVGPDIDGSITSQGYNLIGKTDGSSGWHASDLTGTVAAPLNPLLGSLQNNGGPTSTFVPQPSSGAIDNGDDSLTNSITIDQRGRPRKGGAHVDIGAVEIAPISLVVSNNSDSGAGSLRQTIQNSSVVDGDNIVFAPGVTGIVVLSSELLINKSLNIIGPGAKLLAISGNSLGRVFNVTNGPVNISGLTIRDGFVRGGFVGSGQPGRASLGGHISGSGGAALGGAVYNQGSLTINSSTVDGNTISYGAGGIGGVNGSPGVARGGGVYNQSGTNTIFTSTIASNVIYGDGVNSSGGGFYNLGTLIIYSSTISGNNGDAGGGGISGGGQIRDSIVAGNTALASPDVTGAFTSAGYNIIGARDGSSGFLNGVNQDQIGTVASPVVPLLGPLQDNGGPTFTHALLAGSPAIDKGNSFGTTTDQRGFARIFDKAGIANASGGDGSDIGAFEFQPIPPLLNIMRSGNNALVSWSTNDSGFTLLQNTNLATTNWSAVAGSPPIVSGRYVVTNVAPVGKKFFKLGLP